MTDGQLLLTVFAVFYFVECLHWLPLQCVVLKTWATRRGWAAGKPSQHVAARGTGLAIAWPLPPLGSFFVAQPWPVIPDADGLWIGEGQVSQGHRLKWEDLHLRREEKTITVAPGLQVQCTSPRAATLLEAFLRQTATLKPKKRSDAIESWWNDSLSLPKARAMKRKFVLASWILRMPCILVFIIAFFWLPLLYWRFGSDSWRLLLGVASLWLMNLLVALTWRSLAARLFPEPKGSRWMEVLHLTLIPSHTIRAIDLIGIETMVGLHPLAAASAVLKAEALQSFASQLWLDWKYKPEADPLHPAVALVLPRLEAFCIRLGFSVDALEASPKRQGEAGSFCPRCHAQFTKQEAACEQCGGLATKPWDQA